MLRRVVLPWESPRARLLWSIPALSILIVWQYGILAAGATSFPVSYTPLELPGVIWDAGRRAWWPGEYGLYARWWMREEQIAPFIAVVAWCLCLVPWKKRRARIAFIAAAAVLPGWLIASFPHMLVLWPAILPLGLFSSWAGEEYQDGIIMYPAMAAWWWFTAPLFILAVCRKDKPRAECSSCGYSTVGLRSGVCPECGAEIPTAVASLD